MISIYAAKLYLNTCFTNIGAQKIDDFTLETFGIVLASFKIKDKLGKYRFFKELFLLTETNIEVILKIPFLIFSNTNI